VGMTVGVVLIILGLVGLGFALVLWSNDRRGL
jgi:hypothetical protein